MSFIKLGLQNAQVQVLFASFNDVWGDMSSGLDQSNESERKVLIVCDMYTLKGGMKGRWIVVTTVVGRWDSSGGQVAHKQEKAKGASVMEQERFWVTNGS